MSTSSITATTVTNTVNATNGSDSTGSDDDDTVAFVISASVIIFSSFFLLFSCCVFVCYCLFGPPTLRNKVYMLLIKWTPEEEFTQRLGKDFESV